MKRQLKKGFALLVLGAMLAGCSSGGTTSAPAASTAAEEASAAATEAATEAASTEAGGEAVDIETLTIMYVNSRDTDAIMAATSGLGDLLKEGFAQYGYNIGNVEIKVSEDYNACGEALSAGTADIAYVPGNTYALYYQDIQLVLTATRDALSNDSDNPADWNGDANATARNEGEPVTYYKGLIYAAPTEKGKALAEKVNAGEELTWDELAACSWSQGSTTSGSGYVFPNLWLMDRYDKSMRDLPTATNLSYAEAFQQAAAEQIDIILCYADGRQDYEEQWQSEWGREDSIWNELNVIGVTENIYNDTVCCTKQNDIISTPEFQNAMAEVWMNLNSTDAGKEAIGIYDHSGYQRAEDADYETLREALEKAAE